MPLHQGHLALIEFALYHCEHVHILLCDTAQEPIKGEIRWQWLEHTFKQHPNITLHRLSYTETELPNTSVSSWSISEQWANYLKQYFISVDVFVSSEPYGAYMAHFLNIPYLNFDIKRTHQPISATQIREKPLKHWAFIAPAAHPYFVQKICLYGTESTGKTRFTLRLAEHFNTSYVSEAGRDVVSHTDECTFEQLQEIAIKHALAIEHQVKQTNKLLFIDTDLCITRSYGQFLFGKTLAVESWIETANQMHLHLFLNNDAPYIQDGTRLNFEDRNRLQEYHLNELKQHQIPYLTISGSDWEQRYTQTLAHIQTWIEPLF